MKKILIILPSLSMGGAENMTYELVKNISKKKFITKVICYWSRLGTVLEEKMEAISDVEYMGITRSITPYQMIRVMRKISSFSPDIVHAHLGGVTFALPWCKLHQKPLILTVHTKPDKAFSHKNQNQIRRFINSKLLTIVAVSEENYNLVKRYYNIDDSRVKFVNNGIDVDRFYSKPHELFTFINVARHDENKNQKAIISSFARLCEDNNCKLYLLGDGPTHEELQELIKRLNMKDRIVLPGVTRRPESFYAISDVYVQASHREALPLSVLEAMAAGLPIISTNVGGLKDVVRKNGILVEDNDVDALTEAMKKMISMKKEEYDYMCSESKSIASEYSSRKMAIAYESIYMGSLEDKNK